MYRGTRRFLRRHFIDSMRIYVTGGSGGMGLPKYGGTGGKGGDVRVIGTEGITLRDTLRELKVKRIKASNGECSHRNCLVGPQGVDYVIKAPIGISVFLENGSKLGELNSEGDEVILAKGGHGGSRETSFNGDKGESHVILLDLKIIADVGLVGFPNAGKSTILSIISNAKPKIASYPFTTIHPSLGVMEYPDLRSISVADLPGLIEGSHINFGMGHRFLKHVERTKVLLVVVDIAGFRLSQKYKSRSCLETIILLNKELELYCDDIINKPAVLVVNKMDRRNSKETYKDLRLALDNYEGVLSEVPDQIRPLRPFEFEKVLCMSSKDANEHEIDQLKTTLREVLDLTETCDETIETSLAKSLSHSQSVCGPVLT